MTDSNVVDLFHVREDEDPLHQAAIDFLVSKGSRGEYSPTEMRQFATELMSLSLALLSSPEPGNFEQQVKLTQKYIKMRASHLRAKFIARDLILPPERF